VSVRLADPAELAAAVPRLRESPPASLGGRTVRRVDDLAAGYQGLPPTEGLRLALDDGARVVIRPSGTEPKLKCYLQVVVDHGASPQATAQRAEDELAQLRADVQQLVAP